MAKEVILKLSEITKPFTNNVSIVSNSNPAYNPRTATLITKGPLTSLLAEVWNATVQKTDSPFSSHVARVCCCGRDKIWHEEHNLPEDDSLWHCNTHTMVRPTSSYGVVQFDGFCGDSLRAPVSYYSCLLLYYCVAIFFWSTEIMDCMLFWFENKSCAHALGGVRGEASCVTIGNSCNTTKTASFPLLAVLPEDVPLFSD